MTEQRLTVWVLSLVLAGGIGGCTAMPQHASVTTLPSSAFFTAAPEDVKILQALSKAKDPQLQACHKGQECEDAYYVRGLVALFANRADAIAAFQQLHTAMPTSRYDAAAVGWLNLLQDNALPSPHSRALMTQLKHEVLHTLHERLNTALAHPTKETDGRLADVRR